MSARSDLRPNRTLLICLCLLMDTFQEPVVASQSKKLFFFSLVAFAPVFHGEQKRRRLWLEKTTVLSWPVERSGAGDRPGLFRWNLKLTFPGFFWGTAAQICERNIPIIARLAKFNGKKNPQGIPEIAGCCDLWPPSLKPHHCVRSPGSDFCSTCKILLTFETV